MVAADNAADSPSERQRLLAREPLVLAMLLAAAFAVRFAVRIAFGQQYFWTNSYIVYYHLTANLAAGKGFCAWHGCAWEPPLYPLFLTLSVLAGNNFWLIVVPQALFGTATAGCAYLIGREMFNRRSALIAAAITAFYPYYVIHDTALQDTGMTTLCVALSVWLLLRAFRRNRNVDWLLAGIALGTIPLARASLTLAIPVGLLWCAAWGASGTIAEKFRKSAILALAATLTVGPWLFYTYRTSGVPVITSQSGLALWIGNNPDTFSYYPAQSIDRSHAQAFHDLSPADRAELASRANDEIATSNWYAERALQFMWANPLLVVQGALRKIAAGFSWRLNPYREPLAQAAYFIGYVPIALLGIVGMILARRRRGTILIAMLFLAFILVTAVFWSHTSHRSYLDVYWIVFAASVVDAVWSRFADTAKTAGLTAPENRNTSPGTARARA